MTATVLALALVWRDADVAAIGNFEMPYQVNASQCIGRPLGRCNGRHLGRYNADVLHWG